MSDGYGDRCHGKECGKSQYPKSDEFLTLRPIIEDKANSIYNPLDIYCSQAGTLAVETSNIYCCFQVVPCAVTSIGSVQASAQDLHCKRCRGQRLEDK